MKIFLSAASTQFKTCRDNLASDLRAIGCEVRVQEDFQQGARSLIECLQDYVGQCDRVIALVGDAYGANAVGDRRKDTEGPRSYTQWEYYMALGERAYGPQAQAKDLLLYFASPTYLQANPVEQSPALAQNQETFKQSIITSGKHRGEFDDFDQLCRLVLRDGWQMHERPRKPRNLPFYTLGPLFKGRAPALQGLCEQFAQNPQQAVVIHGLGGMGKSRLAFEYAHQQQQTYSALLWIGADSHLALDANLASLCHRTVLDLPEQAATEQKQQVAAVMTWLETHPGWLLILDNVDDVETAEAVIAS